MKLKPELINRFKTLLWSIGWIAIAMLVDFAAENIGLFGLPDEVTILLGLVLAQISKFVKNLNDTRA